MDTRRAFMKNACALGMMGGRYAWAQSAPKLAIANNKGPEDRVEL